MRSRLILAALMPAVVLAASPGVEQARQLYQQTEYLPALDLLKKVPSPDVEALLLTGQTYYGLGNYSQATEVLERAARLAPNDADVQVWLGRAWGRRAESSAVWNQLRYAGRAHEAFERAVALDPQNRTALADLFEFYIEAPGIAGGGLDKAAKLVPRMTAVDAAWGERAQARIDEARNDFNSA